MMTRLRQVEPPWNDGYLDQQVENTISEMRKYKTAGHIEAAALDAYTLMHNQKFNPNYKIPALDEVYVIFQDLMKQWRSKGYSRFVNLNYWVAVHDKGVVKRIAKKFGVIDIPENQPTIEREV